MMEKMENFGFYDKLRITVRKKLSKFTAKFGEDSAEIILLAPDLFVLLTRLIKDSRVSVKHKIILGAVVAYWILPFDILPEAIFSVIGYADDILITLYIINAMITETGEDVIRENWPGKSDIILKLRAYLEQANAIMNMVGGNIAQKAIAFARALLGNQSVTE